MSSLPVSAKDNGGVQVLVPHVWLRHYFLHPLTLRGRVGTSRSCGHTA